MNPTQANNFTRAVEAHSMGDLLNSIRFLLLDRQEMKEQIRALENRAMGLPVVIEPPERNFTDGLEQDDNFPDPVIMYGQRLEREGNYCEDCKGPCKRNFCIYCGAKGDNCTCE